MPAPDIDTQSQTSPRLVGDTLGSEDGALATGVDQAMFVRQSDKWALAEWEAKPVDK